MGTNNEEFRYADSVGSWNIVYPTKVYDSTVDRSKETKEQGVQSALLLLGIGSVMGFLFLSTVFKSVFGLSSFWAFLIVLIVVVIIGSYVFRFGIFKEDDKLEEYNNEDTSDLGKFYDILNGVEEVLPIGNSEIPCYKMVTGAYRVCIKLKHGATDAVRRVNSKRFIEDVANILGLYNLSYDQLTMGEKYEDTEECATYRTNLNNVENPKLQETLMKIFEANVSESIRSCKVDAAFLIIECKNSYQKYNLMAAISDIIRNFNGTKLVYSDLLFLTHKEYTDVCKDYYGVEVIDLSTIHSVMVDRNILLNYSNLISTVSVETVDGRIIRYDKELEDALKINNVKDL